MWIAHQVVQTPIAAGFFNIDYVLATLVFAFGYPLLGASLVVAALACDALRTFDVIFHFRQQDFFYCAAFVTNLPFLVVAKNIALLVGTVTAWFGYGRCCCEVWIFQRTER